MSLSKSCLSTLAVNSSSVIKDWYFPSCAVVRDPITRAFLAGDPSPFPDTSDVGYATVGDIHTTMVERQRETIEP